VPTKAVLKNEITESNIGIAFSAFSSFLKTPTAGYRHNKDGKFGGPSSSTLKPAGQMSLAPPSFQASALFEPSLSPSTLTQSAHQEYNIQVLIKLYLVTQKN
jgi:hypothetical protein